MAYTPPTPDDHDLVEAATRAIEARYKVGHHQIAAALRGGDGTVSLGVHLEASVGRASICAEAVALGGAVTAGLSDFETIVAVRHPAPTEAGGTIRVVPPCGLCRELLLDYAPDLHALLPAADGQVVRVRLTDLLPEKYVGTKWRTLSAHRDAGRRARDDVAL